LVKFQPVVKWSGSKRSQSEQIVSLFPMEIDTYYEPFVGGASILYQLLSSDIKVNNYICSDINKQLIDLWNFIKDHPNELIDSYDIMWNELNADDDLERKKQYFYKVRERFNELGSPKDFLFISRTTTNGLIRYNKKGEFNNSFHVTRKGIIPSTLASIILDWSNKLNDNNVQFIHQDYSQIHTYENDLLYLDPPYAGVKGMYYGTIDYNNLWSWLNNQEGKYILSFDGKCGKENRTYNVPTELYSEHLYLESGKSTFKKVRFDSVEDVQESLYIK
jgi:DNA adenine methylase